MEKILEDKVVLITGGSSGIGRATALLAAQVGARVVISADKNIDGGQETVDKIESEGNNAAFV